MNKKKYMLIISAVISIFGLMACQSKTPEKMPKFMGYVENTQLNVTTRMPGKIEDIYVDEGDTLKAGQIVAKLDSKELEANLSALKTKLKNIAVNKNRVLNLFKAGAVSKQKLDEIETGYAMLSDKISGLEIRLNDMTITAPVDGIVSVKVLEKGQMMPPGMPVVIETDPSETWGRFAIPETYLDQIDLGKKLKITSNIPNLVFDAKVVFIAPVADFGVHTPTTLSDEEDVRTFDIKVKILNKQMKCKPGMSLYLSLNPIHNQNTN